MAGFKIAFINKVSNVSACMCVHPEAPSFMHIHNKFIKTHNILFLHLLSECRCQSRLFVSDRS